MVAARVLTDGWYGTCVKINQCVGCTRRKILISTQACTSITPRQGRADRLLVLRWFYEGSVAVLGHGARAARYARKWTGLPGVFFFYEVSPLVAEFEERRRLARAGPGLAAIVGGVHATAALVDRTPRLLLAKHGSSGLATPSRRIARCRAAIKRAILFPQMLLTRPSTNCRSIGATLIE